MNVIFLDIDGVLNGNTKRTAYEKELAKQERKYLNIDDSALEYLKKLQNKYEAKIVLTSTWRWPIESLKEDLKNKPVTKEERMQPFANLRTLYEKLMVEYDLAIDDATESIGNRLIEIELYLLTHPEIEKFVILDDDDYKFSEIFKQHFIKCCLDGKSLGEKEYKQACDSFNQQKRYMPNEKQNEGLQNYYKSLTERLKREAKNFYDCILEEDFETFVFEGEAYNGKRYRELYTYLNEDIKKEISREEWRKGEIETKNGRTFKEAVIIKRKYYASVTLMEADGVSKELYDIFLDEIDMEEESTYIIGNLIEELSDREKNNIVQQTVYKYRELSKNKFYGQTSEIENFAKKFLNKDIKSLALEEDRDNE